MPVVEVRDLSVRYGAEIAVERVNFDVEAGETVALVGANGAGKTSTINALLGVLKPSSGSVRVLDADPRTDRARIASHWGVMPQSGGLPMGLTAGECVQLFAELYGRGAHASSALDDCGLAGVATRRWRNLSGGQQQRLSLAIALVGGKDLLILDEPTAALDVQGQQRVIDLLRQRSDAGGTVLFTTHRFEEVEQVAERVVVLHDRSVVCDETVVALTEAAPEVRLRGLTHEQARSINDALGTAFQPAPSGEVVSALGAGSDPHQQLSSVLQWCEANGIVATAASVGSRSLADVYRELVVR
ncbi:MAG: ABC transporter ATP-binding protein [Acidimicrobiia bacterium]|nr:ABC transporter ATP-binding protein [Acidimicrobiia bacterium]